MHWIIWSLVALYFVTAATVAVRVLQRRRRAIRLSWPRSVTQRQMEHWGGRFLEQRMGWQVSVAFSQASHSLFHCTKPDDQLFVLFLRDTAFFRRLLLILGKHGPNMMGIMVIVPYDPPSDLMIKEAAEVRASVVHFSKLGSFTDCQSARLPGLEAARELTRRVQAVPAS